MLERDQKTCIIQEPGKIIGNKKNLVLNIDNNNNNNAAEDEASTPYNLNMMTNSHGVAFASAANNQYIDYNNNNNNNGAFNQKTTPHLRTKARSNSKAPKSNEEPDLM
jgi:hypothetical protein